MNPPSTWLLVRRNFAHYRRTNIAVCLSTAVTVAVIVGALAVGDSIKHTLRHMARTRLGKGCSICISHDGFFKSSLADRLEKNSDITFAPLLQSIAVATSSDETIRANDVQLLGADKRFFSLAPGGINVGFEPPEKFQVAVNRPLAQQLDVEVGDEILITISKPGLLPRDMPITQKAGLKITVRLEVTAVLGPNQFGRFSLSADHTTAMTAVVDREFLCKQLGIPGRANMILAGPANVESEAISSVWRMEDTGLRLRSTGQTGGKELVTDRVFLHPAVADAAINGAPGAEGIITYLANSIRKDKKSTPYSFVSAVLPGGRFKSIVPAEMKDSEIVINEWLAKDLDAKIDDTVTMKWFVLEGSRLVEKSGSFTVRNIIEIEGLAADRTLVPPMPGIDNTDNCSDWETGLPIDLNRIREKDEEYWDRYRGTPKAFITTGAGKSMWSNRFGTYTSVRPAGPDIQNSLDPATMGLVFTDISGSARAAVDNAMDFGMLFTGLSFFLIVAAIILSGLLISFSVHKRQRQAGLLLAVGLRSGRVRRIILIESLVVSAVGCVIGTALGLVYTVLMINLLSGAWSGAIAGFPVLFSATVTTVIAGVLSGLLAAATATLLAFRKLRAAPVGNLLAGGTDLLSVKSGRSRLLLLLGSLLLGSAVGVIYRSGNVSGLAAAGRFFLSGGMLLIAILIFCYLALVRSGRKVRPHLSFLSLSISGAGRRHMQSLVSATLLAIGIFLTVSINVFRLDPKANTAGTGNFELYAESSLPIFADLENKEGKTKFGLDAKMFDSVRIVPIRVSAGDDASCLNLNRPQRPEIFGAPLKQMLLDSGFSVAAGSAEPLINPPPEKKEPIFAAADEPTLTWALQKKIGEELEIDDELGIKRRLHFAAVLPSSILQGKVIIAEDRFLELFPGTEGHRAFLIDCSSDKVKEIAAAFTKAGADEGMSVETTVSRLGRFAEVQNTYLTIFSVLGGFGLLLGAIGFGVVAARNIMERRGQFAAMQAMGFRRSDLVKMVVIEHLYLVAWGTVGGIVASIAAVLPVLKIQDGWTVVTVPLVLIGSMAVSCLLWIIPAAKIALHGPLLPALRNE